MNEKLKNELSKAFDALNALSIRGEDAERMASAKQALRNAYTMIDASKKETPEYEKKEEEEE